LEKLSEAEIDKRLGAATDWTCVNDSIQKTFQFDDFVGSMAFIKTIADHAEAVQHHPDILVRYNKVTLTLSTHDANGITEKDFDFADFSDRNS